MMSRRLSGLLALGVAFAVLMTGGALLWTGVSTAETIEADLSNPVIAITTGFAGADVVLFGATDGPGAVAVVVVGPKSQITVWRKERIAGVWVNRHSVRFDRVPSYYAVAASQPLADLAEPAVLASQGIGVDSIVLQPYRSKMAASQIALFRQALLRRMQHKGRYSAQVGEVVFLGDRLFRTTISLPATVATGTYEVAVFLFRNHSVATVRHMVLTVRKVGLSADISQFAQQRPIIYGLGAVIFAFAIGLMAGTLLGKL